MVLKKFFLTGGSGRLGQELQKISGEKGIEIIAPDSKWCNITNEYQIKNKIEASGCDVVVHAAAFTDVKGAESDPSLAWDVNVLGTLNVLKACKLLRKKLIYISTDYVFDGEKGKYKICDPINPLSKYAKTKASGELLVRTYDESLIIRTSFYGHDFPYDAAFTDQWTSKSYVDVIAPKILEKILENPHGISHVGVERRTVYDIARERKKDVKGMSRNDISINVPYDTSFDLN